MIPIDIKNRLFTLFAKVVNIFECNSKRLSIRKAGSGETCIYYTDYDKDPFYLVINDFKGYFEQNDDNKYLTMIFTSKSQKMMLQEYGKKLKKLLMKVDEFSNYDKNYDVISFYTDDILSLNSIINIRSLTIIIKSVFKGNNKFYPQIYLTGCTYNEI